jgi:hypothetical protein
MMKKDTVKTQRIEEELETIEIITFDIKFFLFFDIFIFCIKKFSICHMFKISNNNWWWLSNSSSGLEVLSCC